jgi:hypothetical protein
MGKNSAGVPYLKIMEYCESTESRSRQKLQLAGTLHPQDEDAQSGCLLGSIADCNESAMTHSIERPLISSGNKKPGHRRRCRAQLAVSHFAI